MLSIGKSLLRRKILIAMFLPLKRRPGAIPVQVKPQAREARVLPCCLKVRTDCREASWHVSHPGSGLQDTGYGFPGFMASVMG